ncbi:MAG: DUF4886 domain-containing protein [Lentisphaeria bacterium]|nr:DUF4886 domain-containing protein [Lentisphaeria bacterium]
MSSLLAFSLFSQAPETADVNDVRTVRVLAIGNSWCWSLVRYFKQVVESTGEYKLELEFVVSGGWTFQRHWKEYEKTLADPSSKFYQYGLLSTPDETRYSLVDKLEMKQWDFVVLTQGPQHTEKADYSQPYLNNLMAVIREHVPTAAILLQHCWSETINAPSFGGDLAKAFAAQTTMYENMTAATDQLAAETHLRVIPTGYVVEKYRQGKEMPIVDVNALEKIRPKNAVPKNPDLVGYFMWYKLGTPQEHWLADTIHLNDRGEYMQACLWYAMLLGENPEDVDYVPNGIDSAEAKDLRTLVKDGLAEYLREKDK